MAFNRRPEDDVMDSVSLLDCAGQRRSHATLSRFPQGRSLRNKGLRYPADPPTVEEIIAVMRAAGDSPEGVRLRAVIVVLWQATRGRDGPSGLGGSAAMAGAPRGAAGRLLVLRVARTDAWSAVRAGWDRCPATRRCRIGWGSSSVCAHQLLHAHAVEMSREVISLRSSSDSSGMPTSGSRRLTCAGSITPKSSTPSPNVPHP